MQALARRIYERTAPGRHRAYLLWVKEGVCPRNSSLQISEGTYPRIAFLLVFPDCFRGGLPEDVFLPVSAGTSEVVPVEP